MKEIWRDIEGYEGYYQVSNSGRVKSVERVVQCRGNSTMLVRERILKHGTYKDGYTYVVLSKNGKQRKGKIHRLVSVAFIANPNNYPDVNHIDGIRNNNHVDNLEWCTHSHNMRHKFKIGNDSNAKGKNAAAKKVIDNETGKIYECAKDAAIETGINYNTLAGYLNGNYKNKTTLRYL